MILIDTQISLSFIYDFDRALDRLSGDPLNSVDLANRILQIPMDEGNVITVQATGTRVQPSFIVSGALNNIQIQKASEILHFNESLDGVSAHFANTDLAIIFAEHEGTPLIRSFSLYGTLMRSIIHQQLNMSFANTLSMRFVKAFGSKSDGVLRYPSPETVANLDVSTLREMQFSTRKAEYMIGLSQAIAEGSLELEMMRQMDDDEVTVKLTTYRGIGPWTAQSFLMSGLGRPNLFPIADIGLQNALKILWKLEKKPTKQEIIARFPDWTPYLSYAALYLWRSIE